MRNRGQTPAGACTPSFGGRRQAPPVHGKNAAAPRPLPRGHGRKLAEAGPSGMLPSGDSARKHVPRPGGSETCPGARIRGQGVVRRANRRRVDRVPGERRRKLARILRLCLPTVVALALLGGLGTVGYRRAVAGDLFRVKEIRFHGLSRTRPEDLLAILPVQRGDHLLLVDPEAVEAALLRDPWVARAEVRRRLPPALDVDVTERRAVALVDLSGLYLVDARGEVFKRAAPGDGLDLPVVTGIERDTWIERRGEVEPLLSGALALMSAWAEARLDGRAPISEIHVDPDLGATVTTGDGAEVRLGQRDLEEKLSRLSRLLPALDAEGRKPEVIHLDNRRHPDWVAVRFAGSGGTGLIGSAAKAGR